MKQTLNIVKIGGNIIDDADKLSNFLTLFSQLQGSKLLVHGGGKLATSLAKDMGIGQQLIDGRRVTDAATLKIVTMVYAGYINKTIVAKLQSLGVNAIGLSGADGNAIQAHKRIHLSIDYGFVGDIDNVDSGFLLSLLAVTNTIVFAPITHDKNGQLLNTNADTIARELATALIDSYDVQLIYSFEKPGVLLDATDHATVIPVINATKYQQLKAEQKIFDGMIPKLDNAFTALQLGVKKVIIGDAAQLLELVAGKRGTALVVED